MFAELGVNVPIARDPEQCLGKVFKTTGIPAMFIIGPKGVVQDLESGYNPGLAAAMSARLDKLLAGEDIYPERLELLAEELKQYTEWLENWVTEGLLLAPGAGGEEVPRAEIAKRSEPATLKLTSLWKYTESKQLGNILVVPQADGPARLLAIDNWTAVADIGPDGKLLAKHELDIPKQVPVGYLRTGVGADGKRYFVGWAPGMQQLHLFDEDFKRLLSYPTDALEHPHAGLTDVYLADLDGDGTLKLYVAYGGDAGLQAVSLEGKRLWSFRSLGAVPRMAVGGPDQQGRRNLLCADRRGRLVVVDSKGKDRGTISLPERPLRWITTADLDGDGQPELCGLSSVELGVDVAVGLTLPAQELWSYELPKGVHDNSLVEPVSKGSLSGEAPGQWLLAAADGSIHIIAADGKPVDRFNYGATLRGLATAGWDGRHVLLVSSPDGLEALQVKWPAGK